MDQKYNEKAGRIDAKFSHEDCDKCPYRDPCLGQRQKNAVKVSISSQMVNRSDMQKALGDEEHKQLARERNAVEAVPSIFLEGSMVSLISEHLSSNGCVPDSLPFVLRTMGKSIRSS